MLLSEKLDEYSKQGDTNKFKVTYNQLKDVIEHNIDKSKYKVNVYLQGSYVNDTNILGDSDVDIIVELENMFNHNINEHPESVQKQFHAKFKDSDLSLYKFKNHIKDILDDANYRYIEKSKCIKVTSGVPLSADLIICNKYRKYTNYPNKIEGIFFKDKYGHRSISFPKLHKENMTNKNLVMKNFKQTVRIFKNFKNEILDLNLIEESAISSYHVESLLYNVPNKYFSSYNLEDRINDILVYLVSNYDNFSGFVTPCNQKYLFGRGNDQWKTNDALNFLIKIRSVFFEGKYA